LHGTKVLRACIAINWRGFPVAFNAGIQLIGSGKQVAALAGMIRKVSSGKSKSGSYRLYSRKVDPKTGRRKNLGTFATREEAEKHERAVQYFKRAH
jgi:hypothetical protein